MRKLVSFFVTVLTTTTLLACSAQNTPQPATQPAQPTAQAATATAAPADTPAANSTATATDTAAAQRDPIAIADAFFQAVLKGDYEGATKDFDATMKSKAPAATVKQIWESLPGQVGAYQKLLDTRQRTQGEYTVVTMTLQFEKAVLDMLVPVNTTSSQITGWFFAPGQAPGTTPTPLAEAPMPDYIDRAAFEERDVTVGTSAWALPGTLSMPKGAGPFPAVVLVAGSGPNDRDETVGPNKPFRDIAWGLTSQGIAVLRYDKRTKVHGAAMTALPNGLTVKEEVIDDAVLAADLLRKTNGIDPQHVYVLGHSLGGMLAPRIGQADLALAGLVILAGATRPLEDLMVEQTEYLLSLDGSLSDADQARLDEVKQEVAKVKALKPSDTLSAKDTILGAPPQYWLDLQGYKPAEVAKELKQPMLILQGERDYQVTMANFKDWQTALGSRTDVQFKTYADLNHLFIAGQGKPNSEEYANPGHVSAAVVTDIAQWIGQTCHCIASK
jgi:uncharacterized protein